MILESRKFSVNDPEKFEQELAEDDAEIEKVLESVIDVNKYNEDQKEMLRAAINDGVDSDLIKKYASPDLSDCQLNTIFIAFWDMQLDNYNLDERDIALLVNPELSDFQIGNLYEHMQYMANDLRCENRDILYESLQKIVNPRFTDKVACKLIDIIYLPRVYKYDVENGIKDDPDDDWEDWYERNMKIESEFMNHLSDTSLTPDQLEKILMDLLKTK